MNNTMADAKYSTPAISGVKPRSQRIDGQTAIAYLRAQSVIRDPCTSAIFYR
jgi:hypothetical protein